MIGKGRMMDNITAKISCFARAYHCRHNTNPIFSDPAAELLLGNEYAQIAGHMAMGINWFFPDFQGTQEEGLRMIVDRQLSPSVLGRSAYSERMLQNELQFGCSQYVIFASGYDTFAVRNAETRLSVYELDLPEVLEDKKKRIREAGLVSCAHYIPCDLRRKDWVSQLYEKGFDPKERSFGSMLGITYYMSKSDWAELLKEVSGIMSKGSAVCFDYQSDQGGREAEVNQKLAAGAGEAMKAAYSYREMEELLDAAGFLIYEHLNADEMTQQYFSGYNASSPQHPIHAPEGVNYIIAAKE